MTISKAKVKRFLDREIKVRFLLQIISTFLALFILWNLYKKGVVAPAFINGEPITFGEILRIVQDKGGPKNALDQLIVEKIIEFEAKKRNIIVKKEEIDAEIAKAEKKALENGKTLLELYKESGQSAQELEKNVKLRITLYKILSQDVDVTEAEIDSFIDKNKDMYKGQDREEIRKEVKELLISQKTQELYDSFITEAKANTKFDFFIKTR